VEVYVKKSERQARMSVLRMVRRASNVLSCVAGCARQAMSVSRVAHWGGAARHGEGHIECGAALRAPRAARDIPRMPNVPPPCVYAMPLR